VVALWIHVLKVPHSNFGLVDQDITEKTAHAWSGIRNRDFSAQTHHATWIEWQWM